VHLQGLLLLLHHCCALICCVHDCSSALLEGWQVCICCLYCLYCLEGLLLLWLLLLLDVLHLQLTILQGLACSGIYVGDLLLLWLLVHSRLWDILLLYSCWWLLYVLLLLYNCLGLYDCLWLYIQLLLTLLLPRHGAVNIHDLYCRLLGLLYYLLVLSCSGLLVLHRLLFRVLRVLLLYCWLLLNCWLLLVLLLLLVLGLWWLVLGRGCCRHRWWHRRNILLLLWLCLLLLVRVLLLLWLLILLLLDWVLLLLLLPWAPLLPLALLLTPARLLLLLHLGLADHCQLLVDWVLLQHTLQHQLVQHSVCLQVGSTTHMLQISTCSRVAC
jgi:hypothetical protein